jgi:hypothetical protein
VEEVLLEALKSQQTNSQRVEVEHGTKWVGLSMFSGRIYNNKKVLTVVVSSGGNWEAEEQMGDLFCFTILIFECLPSYICCLV